MTIRVSTWEGNASTDAKPFRVTLFNGARADGYRFRTEAERADFVARVTEHYATTTDTTEKTA